MSNNDNGLLDGVQPDLPFSPEGGAGDNSMNVARDEVSETRMGSSEDPECAPSEVDKENGALFKFESSLTIAEVGESYEEMKQALEGVSGELHVDYSAVERIDGAGLQLLFAFVSEAKDRGIRLKTVKSNSVLTDSMRVLGLDRLVEP